MNLLRIPSEIYIMKISTLFKIYQAIKAPALVLGVVCLLSCKTSDLKIPYQDKIINLPMYGNEYGIDGFAVGVGPKPGAFYLLSKLVSATGSRETFENMLHDENVAVRAMGLVCLLKNDNEIELLKGDDTKILAIPFGCGGEYMTLEEFSRRLMEDDVFRACFCADEETAWQVVSNEKPVAIDTESRTESSTPED